MYSLEAFDLDAYASMNALAFFAAGLKNNPGSSENSEVGVSSLSIRDAVGTSGS